MNIDFIKKYKFLIMSLLSAATGLSSCVDDKLDGPREYNPADDPNMVCLPFNLLYDATTSTRDGEDRATEQTEPGIVDGTDKEHAIDFDTDKECYAIFFGEDNKFKYIKRLYLSNQLGSGKKEPEAYEEFSVPVVCYIPVDDCLEKTENGKKYYELKEKLKLLVVLNGGPIYNKIEKKGKEENPTISDFLNLTWDNPADYIHGRFRYDISDREYSQGTIGRNSKENFTMTNSAYWGKDPETNEYHLMTATTIDGRAYSSINQYLEDPNNKPSATVYVERMVAKFTPPTFQTAVIGENRVFRPDQNAMALVVYEWDAENNPVTSPKNWRIHLLGWEINGMESQSYIFKNIGDESQINASGNKTEIIENPRWRDWNDADHHRSYWSIDPHYYDLEREDGLIDFYPWQFRKAADRTDIISVQAGLNIDETTNVAQGNRVPVLRYKSFNDIVASGWQTLYNHENTYDPDGNWYNMFASNEDADKPDNERAPNFKYLDGRASLLAGPHLLLVGELYIEGKGDDYVSSGIKFGRVPEIYSDRMQRFYWNEIDWFKMFVKEFNHTLDTQESMNFPVYNWDETSDDKSGHSFVANTQRKPKLYFDGNELTAKYIDDYLKDNENFYKDISWSEKANIRNGDGRLIPWLKGKRKNGEEIITMKVMVEKIDANGNIIYKDGKPVLEELSYTPNSYGLENEWTEDMYKSFFYEWFGPIDHYNEGQMYYAGDIRHRQTTDGSNDFYGTVRNHVYKFHVESINSLGVPVSDPNQIIIPGRFNYNDQIIVFIETISWHSRETIVDVL